MSDMSCIDVKSKVRYSRLLKQFSHCTICGKLVLLIIKQLNIDTCVAMCQSLQSHVLHRLLNVPKLYVPLCNNHCNLCFNEYT